MNTIYKCFKSIDIHNVDKLYGDANYDICYPGFCVDADLPTLQPESPSRSTMTNIKIIGRNKHEFPLSLSVDGKNFLAKYDSDRAEINCKLFPTDELISVIAANTQSEKYFMHKPLLPPILPLENYELAQKLYASNTNLESLFYLRAYSELANRKPLDIKSETAALDIPKTIWERTICMATFSISARYCTKAMSEYQKFRSLVKDELGSISPNTKDTCLKYPGLFNENALNYIVEAIETSVSSYDSNKVNHDSMAISVNNNICSAVQLLSIGKNYHWIFIASLLRLALYKVAINPNS